MLSTKLFFFNISLVEENSTNNATQVNSLANTLEHRISHQHSDEIFDNDNHVSENVHGIETSASISRYVSDTRPWLQDWANQGVKQTQYMTISKNNRRPKYVSNKKHNKTNFTIANKKQQATLHIRETSKSGALRTPSGIC